MQLEEQEQHIKHTNSELSSDNNKPTYIIAVPKYHENLYKHIENNHDWLVQTTRINTKKSFGKKITTEQDRKKLEKLIQDLRTEKSEIFIDEEYHPKPVNQSIIAYIDDFLKSKGVNTHYTFTQFYRITVFPGSDSQEQEEEEYLIVPLLIRLKRGKSHSQSKMVVGIDETTGEVIVKDVNPKHFYIERPEPVNEEVEEERRVKMEFLTTTRSDQ